MIDLDQKNDGDAFSEHSKPAQLIVNFRLFILTNSVKN